MGKQKIVTFTGASGAGKDTLARSLGFPYIISTTTRPPRATDCPGEYEHVSHNQFSWLALCDEFAWHQEFAGEWYGTKLEYLTAAQIAKHPSVMILIPERVKTLREVVPTDLITSFYIVSPDVAALRDRLEKRGDRPEKIEQRLREREWDEEAKLSDIPYIFIHNTGTIDEAVERVKRYLK
ncbi:hypothetical protein HYU08_03035 [Candidatus Woesearchaeota archaeon]|nr:hypothetical protein [Candidatus Woesearchaeota archaeon]